MFWKFGFHTPSAIDAKLDKPDVTLEDLFDDEDLIQECKGHNRKLIDFLMKKETILQVLHYALIGAPTGSETPVNFEAEENLKLRKYSYLACEIICCELSFVMDEITSIENLTKIFDFPNQPLRHNFLLSNHFNRIAIILSGRKPFEVAEFLSVHETALSDLLKTLYIFQVSELLPKLTTIQADVAMSDIFKKHSIVEKLVSIFASSTNADEITNICSALLDILNSTASTENSSRVIISHILGEDTLTKLFSSVYQLQDLAKLKNGLPVLTKLIEYGCGLFNTSSDKSVIAALTPILKGQIANISNIFTEYKSLPVSLQDGKFESTVGLERVLLVAHVQTLISIGEAEIVDQILANGVILHILDIFFNYPCHNIFHGQAFKLFIVIIEGSSDALIRELFGKGDLLVRIRTNYLAEPGSAKRDIFDFCHRGFLTKLSNKVQELSCKFLSFMDSEWSAFVVGPLTSQNTRETSSLLQESPPKSSFEANFELHTTSTDALDDDDEDEDAYENDNADADDIGSSTFALKFAKDPLESFNPTGNTAPFDATFDDTAFDADFDSKFGDNFSSLSFPDKESRFGLDTDQHASTATFEANFDDAAFEANFENLEPTPVPQAFASESTTGESPAGPVDQDAASLETVESGITQVVIGDGPVFDASSEPIASGASLETEQEASS